MAETQVVQGVVVGKKNAHPRNGPTMLQAAAYRTDVESGTSGAASSGAQLDVMQLSCKDSRLPPEVRLGFVKKVYAIVGYMLLITFGIACPFVFATEKTLAWFNKYSWVFGAVMVILLAQYVFNMCMFCQMCCGGSSLVQGYMKMWRTAPWNYLFLTTFSACFGVLAGFICAQYTAQSVVLVFALTFVLIVALTVYAIRTKADFTGCGAYVLVFILGLLMLLMVGMFFPHAKFLHKAIAAGGAMLFGFIIVYDTQLIFGSASQVFGGGDREIEYTIDMYAFAAWNLYLDFINFFLYMLQLFGDRK